MYCFVHKILLLIWPSTSFQFGNFPFALLCIRILPSILFCFSISFLLIRSTLILLRLRSLLLLHYLQIHWPAATGNVGPHLDPPLEATWAALEALVEAGLVRSIGVSNLSLPKLKMLLSTCRIPPAVNQV